MSFEEGLKLALEVGREAARLASNAEAIFVPGGATMSLHVIPVIEEEFGKPTFTRTSAEVWRNLVYPGIIPPVTGWGKLLATPGNSPSSEMRARTLIAHESFNPFDCLCRLIHNSFS